MVSDTIIRTFSGSITLNAGQARGPVDEVNQLRKAYSQTALDMQQQWAKQKGWTTERVSVNKLKVSKRR